MISVVVATCQDEVRFAQALAALVAAATEGVVREVLVVDRGGHPGAAAVADAAGCRIVAVTGELADGLRVAADQARADWLLFLSPEAVLEPAWQGEAMAFIDRAIVAGVGRSRAAVFRLGRMEPGGRARLGEWLAVLRTRLLAAPHAEQGLLVSRSLYRAVGGHRHLAALAEVDLARRIGRHRLVSLRARAVIGEPALASRGVLRAMRNGACLALFVLHLPPRLIGRLAA